MKGSLARLAVTFLRMMCKRPADEEDNDPDVRIDLGNWAQLKNVGKFFYLGDNGDGRAKSPSVARCVMHGYRLKGSREPDKEGSFG